LDEDAIEWLIERAIEALARGEDDAVDPPALTLLLRGYCAGDRADLAEALGPALARAAERDPSGDNPCQHAGWLMLFVEAAGVSDDERIRTAAAERVSVLRQLWDRAGETEPLTWSIEACLWASDVFDPRELVPQAIDELERVVGAAYRPGAGIAERVGEPNGARGRLGDHVRAASALLTAYRCTERLPYAMLAEELMQFARQTLWDDRGGGFEQQPGADAKPFALNCEAARVLCRLAVLHDTPEYSRAAVVAPGADYRQDAARTLTSLEPLYREHGAKAAIYGLALGEWLGLR
jgi:uncharacterized protein YyaL (SSP411 family)